MLIEFVIESEREIVPDMVPELVNEEVKEVVMEMDPELVFEVETRLVGVTAREREPEPVEPATARERDPEAVAVPPLKEDVKDKVPADKEEEKLMEKDVLMELPQSLRTRALPVSATMTVG